MMHKKFSKAWKASKKPGKQRKYGANAPFHVRGRMMSALLSKSLRQKYKTRNVRVRKEDKVLVARGQFKKTIGKVLKVDLKRKILFVEGAELVKKDGTKSPYPIHPSNVIIQEFNLTDKKRKEKLEGLVKA